MKGGPTVGYVLMLKYPGRCTHNHYRVTNLRSTGGESYLMKRTGWMKGDQNELIGPGIWRGRFVAFVHLLTLMKVWAMHILKNGQPPT